MDALRPSYRPALKALTKYRSVRKKSLSAGELETLREVTRRLRRLDHQAGELININNAFIAKEAPKVEFNPETDTVTVGAGELKQRIRLRRADPEKPISIRSSAVSGAYKADGSPADDGFDSTERLKLAYEGLLEDYYHNAHRVLKLVRSLPDLQSFQCREITIVRNKLVEHPIEGDFYSFGYGSNGPVVRPIHRGDREVYDSGLVPNTESFIGQLVAAFNAPSI